MLRLILGRAGSGKTRLVREEIAERVQQGRRGIFLLVPEQYSFESERAMLERLGPRDVRLVEVSSFTRLCERVFRETGGLCGRRLDDGGRAVLMSRALEQVREQLSLYRRQAESVELVSLMLSALEEFKMCAISTEELHAAALNAGEETLGRKLEETALILEAYDALLTRTYIDPLDDLSRLARTLESYSFFAGKTVYLDSFAGFTMQELQVLRLILRQAEEVHVTLSAESLGEGGDRMGLFSSTEHTARALARLARKEGVQVEAPVHLPGGRRFAGKGLRAAEAGVFRPEAVAHPGKCEDVFLYRAAGPYEEADFVARTIRRLVMEEGRRYRDFAVITRTTEPYRGIIDAALEKYGIPCFMDRREPVSGKPLMNLVLSAFQVIHGRFASDDVFRYLKTGLAGLSTEEIALLENYVLLWGIQGARWKEPFTAHPEGFSEQMTEENAETLRALEALRLRVMEPLLRFSGRISSADGAGLAKAAYLLLEEVDAAKALLSYADSLTTSGQRELAEEQLRLWDLLVAILEQTALVLSDVRLSSRRFAELLKLVIEANDIAFIPQGLDEVPVGAADRMRPAAPKIVFVIGAVEGQFPRAPVASGVFSDAERRYLISTGLPMYDALEDLALKERYLAYTAMFAPSERLYVSWPGADASGGACMPSSIVRELARVLPGLAVWQDDFEDPRDLVWAERPGFQLAARHWKTGSRFSETLKAYYAGRADYQSEMSALGRAADAKPFAFVEKGRARELFGERMKLSASQVEKYYLCRFQYFCRYGLRARERRPAALDALEYGSLMHYVLENLLKMEKAVPLEQWDDAALKAEIDRLLEEYVSARLGGWEDKTPRFRYLFVRLAETALVLVRHVARELAQSAFEPADFELSIGREGDVPPLTLALPGGGMVSVEGKVDRVDVMKKNGTSYVRVIDYKTGAKDFKLSDVLYGLNMQMLIYLAAIWENGEQRYGRVLPAGVLYMPANRPVVSADHALSPEKAEAERAKKLRMNGLVLDDPEVIRGMEAQAAGVFIPVALKNGLPAKLDAVASLEEMGNIVRRIEELVVDMARTLREGDIAAEPAVGEYEACAWCPYRPVCGHEDGKNERTVKKWDRNAAMKALEREEKGR